MTDRLKQFIDEHRAEFDSEQPGQDMMKKILSSTQTPKRSIKNYTRETMKWAAAVAGLILVSASLYFFLRKDPVSVKPIAESGTIIDSSVKVVEDPVYVKQIAEFREVIGLKQEELKQLKKEYPVLYEQFVADIKQLDSSYHALQTDLSKNPNREMLLDAMIQNLQLQSELLNRQLLIIREIKQKNKSHEKDIS